MARVTVEDCIDKVENRFELVVLSSQRARELLSGAELTIERNKEKNTVLSLREIAAETVSVDKLRENVVHSFQKPSDMEDEQISEEVSEEMQAMMAAETAAELATQGIHKLTEEEEDGASFAEDNVDVND